MYRGFQLELKELNFNFYYAAGKALYDSDKKVFKPVLDSFIGPNGAIDGSEMQGQWFPEVTADVFISHSHKDEQVAVSIAGWLKEVFGLRAFVDSCIWNYSDDLLKELDNRYCRNDNNQTFNYQLRNRTTAYVHMMLHNALARMMDQCECLFFLSSPQSLVKNIIEKKTGSP
jgi:hypothetical protein